MGLSGRLIALFSEAKRRRVFRTTGVYLIGVWAASQGIVELAPLFEVPTWVVRAILVAAIVFTPVVVILAWMFDIGLSGIVRDPQDVESGREDDLADMQTQLGMDSRKGAVAVSWSDADGEHRILFIDEFFIGRGNDCRVRFYDPLVSRRHARVFNTDGVWQMQDLGSRNGTWLDGERIDAAPLKTKGQVRVNEAGPVLNLELIAPGEETTVALSTSLTTTSTAHVGAAALSVHGVRGAGTLDS